MMASSSISGGSSWARRSLEAISSMRAMFKVNPIILLIQQFKANALTRTLTYETIGYIVVLLFIFFDTKPSSQLLFFSGLLCL
mmetsp:Transcript_4917/g.4053  ORF Transcript_4917/g.4053 Transcript_4917/m.4053 type:complete len:83 (+) Transcript_4917:229-477(+)